MAVTPRHRLAVVLLLLGYAVLGLASVWHESLTYDEPDHWRYGLNILHGEADRFDDSKMPVSALNALPRRLAQTLEPGPARKWLASPFAARAVTVVAGVLLGLLVWGWARQLYGAAAGLLALTLYVLEPNLLAHARLVTTDLYAALTTTLALYCFWRLERTGRWRWAWASAAAFGLAQVAKYSGVFLLPILALAALLRWRHLPLAALRRRHWSACGRMALRTVSFVALVGVVTLLVINVSFLFRRVGTPLEGYAFRSHMFTSLQQRLEPFEEFPVLVAYPWLEGLDWVKQREETGQWYGNRYLNGELRSVGGFRTYYLWAWLLKVPLPTQLLVLAALVTWLARWRRFDFRRDEAFLLLPVAFFFVYLNLFFGAQIGIRYLLVAFPPLLVFTGSLLVSRAANDLTRSRALPAPGGVAPPRNTPGIASSSRLARKDNDLGLPSSYLPHGTLADWTRFGRRGRLALAALLAWLAVSVLGSFPHYLSYFNELVRPGQEWRHLADSNLDWGQNQWYLERWLEEHPGVWVEPRRPRAGTVVVRANFYTGVLQREQHDRWLREHFEPVGHIARSWLVFEIPREELLRLGYDLDHGLEQVP